MEALYQYAWEHRLCGKDFTLSDGRSIRIISPGILNTGSGPDFSNAVIDCCGTRWCGNVEVHTRASDWNRHKHWADPAYDNVILHVVAYDDAQVARPDGTFLPQIKIDVPPHLLDSLKALDEGLDSVRCNKFLKLLDSFTRIEWIQSLGVERLQQKAGQLDGIFRWSGNDWRQTCFVMLARALGFGFNSDPMEMMARNIPLNYLLRHSDNALQLEAMLFGAAGLLNPILFPRDEYYQWLCREFKFLSSKYSLRPLAASVWKSRTRPQNSPHRRIAVLAKFLEGGFTLPSDILSLAEDFSALTDRMRVDVSPYWNTHYVFGAEVDEMPAAMSEASINILMINAVVPYIYAYGTRRSDARLEDLAFSMLEKMPPEQNSIVRSWSSAGIRPQNSFQSQALLYLRREYCNRERCCDCRFAHQYLMQVASLIGNEEFEREMMT